ncbi:MAG: DUF4249 domain-containing protein [Bacteroidales bacterium]
MAKIIIGNQLYYVPEIKKSSHGSSLKNSITVVYFTIILAVIYGLTSCQKVISIDLNSASTQLVVEANISDQPGPYYVKLSKTVNFSDITEIPAVTGAIVEISDSSGNEETLTELKNGIYQASTLKGIPGHKYTLTIKTEGQTYRSVSEMPYPVGNLNLELKSVIEYEHSFGGSSSDQSLHYVVNFGINDPEEYKNYYRFLVYHKNREISSRRVFDDQFHNGKLIEDEFILRDTVDFNQGDTIKIELQNIDEGTYNFFRTLREGAGGMSFLSASPSNPISNISNDGLGYFNACSVIKRFLIIH